jgi:hypothetical protein
LSCTLVSPLSSDVSIVSCHHRYAASYYAQSLLYNSIIELFTTAYSVCQYTRQAFAFCNIT